MDVRQTRGYEVISEWLSAKGLSPFQFQEEAWQHITNGESGLVNAPTGCGKTFSVFLGSLIEFINQHPGDYKKKSKQGLQLLWLTPLRALAKDIGRAMEAVIGELGMNWKIGIRNGDTEIAERQRQTRQMPEVLIITPESLHLLLAQKNYPEFFKTLKIIAVDEWHELLGSKRGVQVELAISRIVNGQWSMVNRKPLLWGISATIGNLEQAKEVLLSTLNFESEKKEGIIIKAEMRKRVEIESIFPDEIEKFPWAGHLGIKLVDKVIPIINNSKTTLIFINTRGMSEIWYQTLLSRAPELAGAIALHHGSIEHELRIWVEEALHAGKLKAVVCTASLDLGVDFRPVETVIQVGSPKGVARFLQRAGRSGHSPDAISKIYFLPTHSLELVEAAALKNAVDENIIESREPMLLCFDVLIQYVCTLAIAEGFRPDNILDEIRSTYCYREITKEEWDNILAHITIGGTALRQYDEFKKIEIDNGLYKIKNRRIAMRHRLQIGTIVSEAMLRAKFVSGGFIGMIEEWFVSRLEPGDVFTLAGRRLEFVMIKEMIVLVRKSNAKKSRVPSWQGGRMPLSANLGKKLRETLDKVRGSEASNVKRETENVERADVIPIAIGSETSNVKYDPGFKIPRLKFHDPNIELHVLRPLFELQEKLSHVPKANELLIEQIETDDGFHLFVYPFEGRLVHEAMAAILAYRISRIMPITFSFAMNDYGFELLSDKPIPVDDTNVYDLFSTENLFQDIQRSVNATEMAKRKFRDIAVIGGLVFQGYPGEQKKARHLQSSASLLFSVFSEYEPNNLLLRQAYTEVFAQQMEEARLRDMLHRVQQSNIIIRFPEQLTPFCFPIKVDSMREDLSSEKLEERVRRMQTQLESQ
ncbi:MAG: ligase-associated DNA damage response DEXH box helicase [Bacteroidetes bacterium]|nr:MAG: ligase-associated DNA damage response DEXH box helicase [Bacteroidota bacterium]